MADGLCKKNFLPFIPSVFCSEGGFFKAHLYFPPEYPQKPPKMKFTSDIWHPNGKNTTRNPRWWWSTKYHWIISLYKIVIITLESQLLYNLLWSLYHPTLLKAAKIIGQKQMYSWWALLQWNCSETQGITTAFLDTLILETMVCLMVIFTQSIICSLHLPPV